MNPPIIGSADAIRFALALLEANGITTRLEVRMLKDSKKAINGVRIGPVGMSLDEAGRLLQDRSSGMWPGCSMELRMVAVLEHRKAWSDNVVTGQATTWLPSKHLRSILPKISARASGVALPALPAPPVEGSDDEQQ